MKTGVIILCRYDSKRLPGKILRKIRGKEVLKFIYERLSRVSLAQDIVVATSTHDNDQPIVDFCQKHKIKYFRGSKYNVAERILKCAQEYNFDYFVRICADNVFVDYKLLDEMITIALKGQYNLVSNLKSRTFPAGASIEVLKTEFFQGIQPRFKTAQDKEHVTSYLYSHESEIGKGYYLYNDICPQAANIKLALDDMSDLHFITGIVEKMDKDHREYLLNDIYALSR